MTERPGLNADTAMAHHHPTDEMLLDNATGAQSAATSLLVACHLTFCPQCRKRTAFFESVGGALFQFAPLSPAAADIAISPSLSEPKDGDRAGTAIERVVDDDMVLPRPLRQQTGCAASDLKWRRVIPGIHEFSLPLSRPRADARLMRIMPGRGVPRHTHEGTEATLVLTGAFSDTAGHYERGDVALADATVDHRPVADAGEPCLCLAVTDAPLRLTGMLGRVISLFGNR